MDFKRFKILLAVEAVLLFIQFYLGISVNLFVSIPVLSPFTFSSYPGGFELLAHITNGILVIALSALILKYAINLKETFISALSGAALIFVVIASERGMEYALGGHYDILSLEMAISFLTVYTLYFLEFFLVEKRRRQLEAKEETS